MQRMSRDWPFRSMAAQQETLSSTIVQRALAACRGVDASSRLASMTADVDGLTRLRVRAGDTYSLAGLQAALASVLPLSTTRVHESFVDGTLEAEVLVHTQEQEYTEARLRVTSSRCVTLWLLLAWVAFLIGTAEYLLCLTATVSATQHDEL